MKRANSILYFTLGLSMLPFTAMAGGDFEHENPDGAMYYPAIIRIEGEHTDQIVDSLRQEGVIIFRERKDLLLCCVPNKQADEVKPTQKRNPRSVERPHVKIYRGRRMTPTMDVAREWFDASAIHTGASHLPSPFTGKGVVTGICDIGFDPMHIAFMDSEGMSRVCRVTQYRESKGERLDMGTETEYIEWKTDDESKWHATHVAGIMAGGYGVYHGMAPDSEIVVSTSELSDVGLLCGAEDILEYAKSVGKRAVINMSMGNYTGPHDGTSLFSQYLDMIGEEAIVVLSSGNAGNLAATLPVKFTEEKPYAALGIYSTDWVQFDPYGGVDVWSATDSPVRVRLAFRDIDEGRIVKYFPWYTLYDGETVTITSDPDYVAESEKETVIHDAEYSALYDGSFALCGAIDPDNGRHHMILAMDAHTDIESSRGAWARYVPVIEVGGVPGAEADIYADGAYTVFRALPGGPTPGSALSFSDLATGHNVISVGMYVSRDTFPRIDGGTETGPDEMGTVSKYSSYATLRDGRVMPITVGPGDALISAISGPYMEAHPGDRIYLNGEDIVDGVPYGWISCRGTSMSAPFVAGSIACWLEALPELTVREVIDFIERSNRTDVSDPANPRHGRGWFDPLEGLKEALEGHLSVGTTLPESSGVRLAYSSRQLTVFSPISSVMVEIYTITGKRQLTLTCPPGLEHVPLGHLPKGIYLATIPGTSVAAKIAVD